jgi:hypothetical protein
MEGRETFIGRRKNLNERDNLKDLGVDGGQILIRVLNK